LKQAKAQAAVQTQKAPNDNWWRGGVIYQIYPRSFADTNGDGIGDLPGITAHLDYVAALGVDGIWLSPFFPSPMKDFGYDVSDYHGVDPMFGTLDDFRHLVAHAHAVGLKVVIDQVLSHSSDQHPWFVESRSNQTNKRADWYVWADARGDGNPPNNWLSVFGGSAWQWDTRRCQYYLHNYLTSQPDLNYHNREVRAAMLESVRFWLDLGVDGYRLDTVNFYVHDAQLRDNPPRGRPDGTDPAVSSVNPYAWQWHQFDKSQPENLDFIRELRALLDQYPNTATVGEIGDDDGLARMAEYTRGEDLLHMAYCFDLLGKEHSAPFLHGVMNRYEHFNGTSWPCWALSNHDVERFATRWGGSQPDLALLKLAFAMQVSLRGSPCIYQGDELGLPESWIVFEDLRDPYGITMWPEYKGRDGCRTPMPWVSTAIDLGFAPPDKENAKPWLPVAEQHRQLAVDKQEPVPDSLLSFYRNLLRWRKEQPALLHGDMELLPAHDQVFAFVRTMHMHRVLCVFNFSGEPVTWTVPTDTKVARVLEESGLRGAALQEDRMDLAPWGGMFVLLV
jgi:alpha-glucosidase